MIAYFIMGRGENSRNRVFEGTEDGIRTKAFDESKMTDPSGAQQMGFEKCVAVSGQSCSRRTDAYVLAALSGVAQSACAVRCGCWAHMRRKWREAMPKGAAAAISKAAIGYGYFPAVEAGRPSCLCLFRIS